MVDTVDLAFLGTGPAGMGPIVCAAQDNLLDQLTRRRIALVDSGLTVGRGSLASYDIRSDTRACVLLECLSSPGSKHFGSLHEAEATRVLQSYGDDPAPLRVLADFIEELGSSMLAALAGAATTMLGRRVLAIYRRDGKYVAVLDAGGEMLFERGVLALGGTQDLSTAVDAELMPCLSLERLGLTGQTLLSDQVLATGGGERVRERVCTHAPRVVILGGSHSALAAAHRVQDSFPEASLTIVARRMPRLFYPSVTDARSDGYLEFTDDDVCPKTGRVFRLAGLRFDGGALLRRILRGEERRVSVVLLSALDARRLSALLHEADVIVAALGYQPRTVPIFDEHGVDLVGSGRRAHVDDACRLLDAHGVPIPGLFGIGLASGFVPSGGLGGEPSFRGQTNGLWLYQNGIGRIVLRGLLD